MVVVSLVASFLLPVIALALSAPHLNAYGNDNQQRYTQATLASDALAEILTRGAPILGTAFVCLIIVHN